MTNLSIYIFGIYQLSMMIRDSLAYVAPSNNKKYSKDAYLKRAETFKILQGPGSPFAHFISLNKENAEKLLSNLNDFEEAVYSPESRIFHINGEVVEVDAGQHLRIYDMSVGLYQTFLDIINGYLKYANDNKELDQRIVSLIASDEYYTRALAHYGLTHDLIGLFKEYSEARAKDKNPDNPIAKFINEDIVKAIGLINFMEKHNKITNVIYKEMTDKVKIFIENISGKRQLPEGKTFPVIFAELEQTCLATLQDAETKWRQAFVPIAKEHAELMSKQDKKRAEELS